MKINWLPLAAAVALAAGSVSASAVDFHGYFRAGAQLSTHGGEVYCLGNGNAGHKVGRLADECDTYGEASLSQEVYNKADSKFTVNTLFAYGSTEGFRDLQGNDWQGVGSDLSEEEEEGETYEGDDHEHKYKYYKYRLKSDVGSWSGQRLSFREMYAKYDTSDGYSIWAGKRYYQRKDIHIMDFYYLNNSGHGAGIENIDVGAGNLNFAVVKFVNGGNNSDYNRNVYKVDARWNAIPVGFGTLDASVIYAFPAISGKQRNAVKDPKSDVSNNANSGVLLTLDHASTVGASDGSFNLMNHLIFQWGTNGFGYVGTYTNHAGGNYNPDVDIVGVRLIDWGTMDFGSDIDLGYSLFWSHLDNGKNHESKGGTWTYTRSGWEYSIVVRPEYKWTEYTRTTLELGYSQMKTTGWVTDPKYDDPNAYKFTLAQQFTPGKGFWSRPAIRFYASYLGGKQFAHGWKTNYSEMNASGHNHQFTFGTQVEAWW